MIIFLDTVPCRVYVPGVQSRISPILTAAMKRYPLLTAQQELVRGKTISDARAAAWATVAACPCPDACPRLASDDPDPDPDRDPDDRTLHAALAAHADDARPAMVAWRRCCVRARATLTRAVEALTNHNLRLVYRLALHVLGAAATAPRTRISDLMQEGMIGLNRAARHYDYRRGLRFSTMATPWIRRFLKQSARSADLITVTSHAWAVHTVVQRARAALGESLGREPTAAEISAWSVDDLETSRLMSGRLHPGQRGLSLATVTQTLGEMLPRERKVNAWGDPGPRALSAPSTTSNDDLEFVGYRQAFVVSHEGLDVTLANSDLLARRRTLVAAAVRTLPTAQRDVIECSHGIGDGCDAMPTADIAAALGVNARRVQYLNALAVKKVTAMVRAMPGAMEAMSCL